MKKVRKNIGASDDCCDHWHSLSLSNFHIYDDYHDYHASF